MFEPCKFNRAAVVEVFMFDLVLTNSRKVKSGKNTIGGE